MFRMSLFSNCLINFFAQLTVDVAIKSAIDVLSFCYSFFYITQCELFINFLAFDFVILLAESVVFFLLLGICRLSQRCCFGNIIALKSIRIYLPLDWIAGYEGGGLIQVPSGRLICRRSDENSAKYCSAGITLKNLQKN